MTEHVCNLRSPWPIGHPLPPENPDRLQGPEVGSLCIYQPGPRRTRPAGSDQWVEEARPAVVVRVSARSYVWSPGECRHGGGYRRYDWKVIDLGHGRTLCVDDSDLTEIVIGQVLA